MPSGTNSETAFRVASSIFPVVCPPLMIFGALRPVCKRLAAAAAALSPALSRPRRRRLWTTCPGPHWPGSRIRRPPVGTRPLRTAHQPACKRNQDPSKSWALMCPFSLPHHSCKQPLKPFPLLRPPAELQDARGRLHLHPHPRRARPAADGPPAAARAAGRRGGPLRGEPHPSWRPSGCPAHVGGAVAARCQGGGRGWVGGGRPAQ